MSMATRQSTYRKCQVIRHLIGEDWLITKRIGTIISNAFRAIRWAPKISVVTAQVGISVASSAVVHVACTTVTLDVRINVIGEPN